MARLKRPKSKQQIQGQIDRFEDFRKVIHSGNDPSSGLSIARRHLTTSAIPEVVSRLCRNPIYHSLVTPGLKPTSYARVRGRLLSRCEDDAEILWTAAVLSQHAPLLNRFTKSRDEFHAAFMRGDYDHAGRILAELETEFGLSIWSISSRLGLTHRQYGISAQKALLDEITATPSVDVLTAYLSFVMSYSLEDGVTLQDIRRDLSEDDTDGFEDYRAYARFHISPFDINSIRSTTFCIWFESASSIVDQFETFVAMSQIMLNRREFTSELTEAYSLLSDIEDIRVQNIRYIVGAPIDASSDYALVDAADAYSKGNYEETQRIVAKSLTTQGDQASLLELAARADGAGAQYPALAEASPSALSIRLLKTHLQMEDDPSETKRQLQALGLAVRKTNTALLIASILDRSLDPAVSSNFSNCEVASYLSGPLIQPHGFKILEQLSPGALKKVATHQPAAASSQTFQLLAHTVTPTDRVQDDITGLGLPDRRAQFHVAYALYNMGKFQDAAEHLNHIRTEHSTDFTPRELQFQLALFKKLDRLDLVLAAFTDAYLTNPEARAIYPLQELVNWAAAAASADEAALDRAILLNAYASTVNTKHDGDLSDALEDTLDHYEQLLPSALVSKVEDKAKLRYFLRYVATIDRLEDTVRLDTLDKIEAERIQILQWLSEDDPQHRGTYTQEIASITKDQEVARLSAQFERSKIYLHEEGVRRTFGTELKPLFERYKQLIGDPELGSRAEHIEQRLRRLLKEAETQVGYILLPSTEREKIYFSMLQRAYDLLVLDPIHGLKTYLSTRILHGVLEGELRSSFTSEELLIPSDSADRVRDVLGAWGGRISPPTEADLPNVASAISKFSESIVGLIDDLKDQKIRIYSKEAPKGLFKISLEDDAYYRLKDSLTPNVEYDEFVDRLLSTFWESIEDCLREVRTDILARFRREVDATFDALERALAPYRNSGGLSELSDAVARSRSAFSFSVERVASWFVRSGVLPNEPFEIERAVEVATIITNNCFPRAPLTPAVEVKVRAQLDGKVLNPVVDLLTNCLQNAAGHSGFTGTSPAVRVVVEDAPQGGVAIRVINEVSTFVNLDFVRSEMGELVRENDELSKTSVASEGRTGIRKMKRILLHDLQSQDRLSFDVSADHTVTVLFTLPERCKHAITHH